MRDEKNKGDNFLLEEQHENFVTAVTKWEMLAAPTQGENERQWKEVNENTYEIERVTKKFLKVSRCSRAEQRQRNVQRKCASRSKVAFLLIRPIAVFHTDVACHRLALHDFIFCSNKLQIFSRASILSLTKSIYYN